MNTARKFWLDTMLKIADPVLDALSRHVLRTEMPVEHHPFSDDREDYTYLEALGRLLCGMAPWLEIPAEDDQEEALRRRYTAQQKRTHFTDCSVGMCPSFFGFICPVS